MTILTQADNDMILLEILAPASKELIVNRFAEQSTTDAAACSGFCDTGVCNT